MTWRRGNEKKRAVSLWAAWLLPLVEPDDFAPLPSDSIYLVFVTVTKCLPAFQTNGTKAKGYQTQLVAKLCNPLGETLCR